MPSTPLNNFDPTNRRNIRRNLSDQIISYTLPPDTTLSGYGLKLIPATTTFYKSERYGEIIDELSDELIDDIPEFDPTIVSVNYLDSDLLVGEGSVVSISLYDDGNNNVFVSPDAGLTQFGNNSYRIAWLLTMTSQNAVNSQFVEAENVFLNTNFENEVQDLFYYRPMVVGTQLYKKNNNGILSEPYEPYWKNDSSYSAVKSFDTSVDTNLNDLLYNNTPLANTSLFLDITEDNQLGNFTATSTNFTNLPNGEVEEIKVFNQKEFAGAVIKVSNEGKVLKIDKIVGEWGNMTNNQLRYETVNL
jgi:hypothetical protein